MHGTTGRKRGRPNAIPRPSVAYPDMGRREREHHRKHLAERFSDTDAAAAENHWDVRIASLALEPYGIALVPNEDPDQTRVLHIFQEWPQQVRGKVSGSIWNPIGLAFLIALMRDPIFLLFVRLSKPSQWKPEKPRCAHRSWKSAAQMIAATWEKSLELRGIDDAAADALLGAIGYLATPRTKRAYSYLNKGINEQIKAKRDQDHEPVPVTFWRPWWQNSEYWRGHNGKRTIIPPCGSDWWGMDQNVRHPRPSKLRVCIGFVSANEWPIDDLEETKLGAGEVWWANIGGTFFRDDPYEVDPAADQKPRKTFLYRPGTRPLQRPDVSADDPFRAVARLWNWHINNRHREQMRIPWPKFAFHSECCRVDRPRAFPDDPGGQCCRWTCGGFKTCPLQCWRRQKRQK
jgi:hypothetical protein